MVHGDIKPDNVLVTDSCEAALCDFGLARTIQEMSTGLTTTGRAIGAKGFVPPEHRDCEGPVEMTSRSDVFAFGGLTLHVSWSSASRCATCIANSGHAVLTRY